MEIPESISEMVWQMQHKWLWTVGMVAGAIGMMMLMMSASEGNSVLELLAFLSCACVAFVGCMPIFNKDTKKAHYALAIIGAVLSQVWCLMIALQENYMLMIYISLWVLAGMIMMDFKKYWCLIAEVFAIMAIIVLAV